MRVIGDANAEVRRALADLRQQPPEPLGVRGYDLVPTRALVDQLQIQAARVAEEPRVAHVLLDDARLGQRVNGHVAARERDER